MFLPYGHQGKEVTTTKMTHTQYSRNTTFRLLKCTLSNTWFYFSLSRITLENLPCIFPLPKSTSLNPSAKILNIVNILQTVMHSTFRAYHLQIIVNSIYTMLWMAVFYKWVLIHFTELLKATAALRHTDMRWCGDTDSLTTTKQTITLPDCMPKDTKQYSRFKQGLIHQPSD